ncbi:MAG: hypothetical protein JNJ54_34950 [Myxococcaceae bacterium]|nr:hypothetical protein [Myxococcaceae bacterium]
MFDEYNPDVVYRAFNSTENHIKPEPPGYRLGSGLFKSSRGVSVYLGAETTLRDVVRRHPNWGVASLPLSALVEFTIERDPEDTPEDLPGHRIFSCTKRGPADRLAGLARIEIRVPGFEVVGFGGSVGVDAPA